MPMHDMGSLGHTMQVDHPRDWANRRFTPFPFEFTFWGHCFESCTLTLHWLGAVAFQGEGPFVIFLYSYLVIWVAELMSSLLRGSACRAVQRAATSNKLTFQQLESCCSWITSFYYISSNGIAIQIHSSSSCFYYLFLQQGQRGVPLSPAQASSSSSSSWFPASTSAAAPRLAPRMAA